MIDASPSALTGCASTSTSAPGPEWWAAWGRAVTVCPCMLGGARPWEGCTDCANTGLEHDWQPAP